MKTTQKTTANPTVQDLEKQIGDLVSEAKEVNKEIALTNKEADAKIKAIDAQVDESVGKLEKVFSDLDQIEKIAADDLDRLVLEQAEELAKE